MFVYVYICLLCLENREEVEEVLECQLKIYYCLLFLTVHHLIYGIAQRQTAFDD